MKTIVTLLATIILTAFTFQSNFLTEQKKFERVKTSFIEKGNTITETLTKNGLQADNINIIIVAYKADNLLDIFAKKKSEHTYKKLISYKICASSGQLGPKRKQGDMQVPEGFYNIDRYNPTSNYYLSLGLNYPNQSDRKKSNASNLGGEIFIHGYCATVGCMPMTDEKIKEIYLYAIHARNNGQLKIPVYVFPFKMTTTNFKSYKESYKNNLALINFWANIKLGYDKFEANKQELNISVSENGDYVFN